MKRSLNRTVMAGLLMVLGTGCGSNLPDTEETPPFELPFTVTGSTPRVGDLQVVLTSPIKFKLNEQIDPTSISTAFKVTETIGATPGDVSTFFVPSLEESNLILTLTPTRPLVFGASYTVALNDNLRSVSARQLAFYTLIFSTGQMQDGVISDPTIAPNVLEVSLIQNVPFGCLGVQVTFNEDLQAAPTGSYKLSIVRGSFPESEGPAYFQPLYQNSYRDWVIVFNSSDCKTFRGSFARLDVKVSRAIDLTGQTMIGEKTAYFDQSLL